MKENKAMQELHEIRRKNYEATKNMTFAEEKNYYEKGASAVREEIEKRRKKKHLVNM